MKKFLLLLLLTTSVIGQSLKLDTLKLNGETYTKVTIVKETPLKVKITHTDGIERIYIKDLPSDIISKMEYDKSEASKYSDNLKKLREEEIKRITDIENSKKLKFWVMQNLESGLIVGLMIGSVETTSVGSSLSRVGGGGPSTLYSITRWEKDYTQIYIPHNTSSKKYTEDYIFSAMVIPVENFTRPDINGARRVLKSYKITKILPN